MTDHGSTVGDTGTLSAVRALPTAAKLVLAGTCLAKLSAFMVWPFIAIVMNARFGTSITEVGLLLSLAALTTIAISPFSGILADRLNVTALVALGSTAAISGFLLLTFFPDPSSYSIAIMTIAIGNGILEPLLRATLGEMAAKEEERPLLFHLRYYLVNIAAAAGPLLGMWFAERQSDSVFLMAACAYIFLAVCMLLARRGAERGRSKGPAVKPRLRQVMGAALKQRLFLPLFLANFLLVFIYAHSGEPLTLHLISLEVSEVSRTVGLLYFTNTVVVLLCHIFLMGRLIALRKRDAYALAMALLLLSQLAIGLNSAAWLGVWLLAVGLAAAAEMIAMPLLMITLDKTAPADLRNSFFGLYIFSNTGGALAPLLAALVISSLGGTTLYLLLSLICLPVGIFGYRILRQVP